MPCRTANHSITLVRITVRCYVGVSVAERGAASGRLYLFCGGKGCKTNFELRISFCCATKSRNSKSFRAGSLQWNGGIVAGGTKHRRAQPRFIRLGCRCGTIGPMLATSTAPDNGTIGTNDSRVVEWQHRYWRHRTTTGTDVAHSADVGVLSALTASIFN